MQIRLADRMRRAAEEASARGLAALVVAPSPDLAYLTGYDPMPLERPTLLVLRPGHDPAMLVPELERALAAASPAGAAIDLVGWTDGADPYAEAASPVAVERAGRRGGPALGEPRARAAARPARALASCPLRR